MPQFVPANVYLNDDRAASAYLQRRFKDLQALQAEFKSGTQIDSTVDLGYATVTKTAKGWLINNLPAISFVAVQAYILAKFW